MYGQNGCGHREVARSKASCRPGHVQPAFTHFLQRLGLLRVRPVNCKTYHRTMQTPACLSSSPTCPRSPTLVHTFLYRMNLPPLRSAGCSTGICPYSPAHQNFPTPVHTVRACWPHHISMLQAAAHRAAPIHPHIHTCPQFFTHMLSSSTLSRAAGRSTPTCPCLRSATPWDVACQCWRPAEDWSCSKGWCSWRRWSARSRRAPRCGKMWAEVCQYVWGIEGRLPGC